jgi:hypothetical protein
MTSKGSFELRRTDWSGGGAKHELGDDAEPRVIVDAGDR